MGYTVKELRNEIDRIKQNIYRNLDFDTRKAVYNKLEQLLTATAVNTTKSGAVRYYLPKTASKAVVDNYLDCLINAMYDTVGFCY